MVRISSFENFDVLTVISFKDIGALSEEHFDAVEWINKTLKSTEEQKSKEVQEIHPHSMWIYCNSSL